MIRNRAYARRAAVVGALVALFMLSIAGTLWAAEYVVNGGFESGLDSWFTCANPNCSVTITDVAHSGSSAAFIMKGETTYGFINQIVEITSGVSYTLTFWSFGDGVFSGRSSLQSDSTGEPQCLLDLSSLPEWSYNECVFSFVGDGPYYLEFGVFNIEPLNFMSLIIDDVSIVGEGGSNPPPSDSTNASTCLMLLLIKLSVAMVVFFAVVSLGMWLGQINIF